MNLSLTGRRVLKKEEVAVVDMNMGLDDPTRVDKPIIMVISDSAMQLGPLSQCFQLGIQRSFTFFPLHFLMC